MRRVGAARHCRDLLRFAADICSRVCRKCATLGPKEFTILSPYPPGMSKANMSLYEKKRSRPLRSRIPAALLRRLSRLGIEIHPFLLVREPARPGDGRMTLDSRFSSGFIGADDIPELVRLNPKPDAAECAEWFQRGRRCFAVKDGSRIVARMWCDLEEFNFPPSYRKLESHEAYLFAAYTDPACRGRSIAPFMRLSCYGALRAIGRTSFFSYTDYFNITARRFKEKLGAVDESLCVHVNVLGCFSRTFLMRRYASRA